MPLSRIRRQAAWTAHLDRASASTGWQGSLGPARIATEGALWGSIAAHGFLRQAVRGSAPDLQRRCRPVRCRPPCALPSRWGRCRPHPSQTRTCRFPASGSSRESFAHGGVAMDDPWWRQRMVFQPLIETAPQNIAVAPSPREPLLPDPHDLPGVPAQSPTIAAYAVVGIVAPHHRGQMGLLCSDGSCRLVRHHSFTAASARA